MYPPRIYRWDQMLFNPVYEGEEFMSPSTEEAINQDLIGNCLTTAKKTNGAVAIFYPGVAERFAGVLDSDLYLVFTSVHEVMVHKADGVDAVDLSISYRIHWKKRHLKKISSQGKYISMKKILIDFFVPYKNKPLSS